ncbi:MAG: flippase [Zetaproteobacteria bacterium]|nr:MAG: flippase [Zetaproteobacteria bacterium]
MHGSAALTVAQTIAQMAAFLMAWSVARGMGDVLYGQFAAAYALATSIAALADSGVRITLIREVARNCTAWKRLLHHALVISLALAVIVSVGFFVVVVIQESAEHQSLRLWLLLFALLWTGMRIILGVPAGHQRLIAVAVWGAVERLGGALLVSGLAFLTDASLLHLAQWLCLWEAGVLVCVWSWTHAQGWPVEERNGGTLSCFAKLAIPFGIAGAVQAVLGRLDLIVLGFQQPPAETGYYAAAQMLALIAVFLGIAVANALFPTLSRLAKDHAVNRARTLLEPALGLLGLMMAVVAAAIAGMAEPLLTWVYGDSFAHGWKWLAIFSMASPLAVLGAMTGAVIGAWGWQTRWAKTLVMVFMAALPVYWLFGTWLGMWGVISANIMVQIALAGVAWRWMYGAGLAEAWWLPRLLLTMSLLGGYVFVVHGWLLVLAPLLAVALVFLMRVCQPRWLGMALRLIR